MKSFFFILAWASLTLPTLYAENQPLPGPIKLTDATQPITIDWIYKEADQYNRGLPSNESWSEKGHLFAYLIASVTEAPNLVFYDPVLNATQSVLTPKGLGRLIDPPAANEAIADVSAEKKEPKEIRIHNFQWLKEENRLRLYTDNGDYIYNRKEESVHKIEYPEGEKNNLTFSPDGRFIAYTRNFDLYAFDFDQRREIRLTREGGESLRNGQLDWVYPEELEIRQGFYWAPDGSAIAYLQQDEEGVASYPITDFSSIVPTTVNKFYPKAGTRNPSVRVGVVRLSTQETRWINLGYLYEYVARISWALDSNSIAIQALNRRQNKLALVIGDAWDGSSYTMFEENDPHWINVSDGPVWLEDTEDFLWLSERDGFRHIYRIENDGKIVKQLTKGEWEVTRLIKTSDSAKQIYFEASKDSPLERHIYRISFYGGRIDKLSAEPGTHSGEVSSDGRYLYDRFNSSATPKRLAILDNRGKSIHVLGQKTPDDYKPYRIDPPRFFTIPGEEGRVYHAQIIYPHDFDPNKKYPLILSVYGGPHAQVVRDSFDADINQVWAANGFIVFSLDNRGSWGRGHAWETPIQSHFGKLELADQLAGIEFMKKQPFVDPDRIGVWGWSFGGFMTCNAMVNAPDVFRAGAAVAPVTDWKLYDTIYTERYMGHPADNPDGYKDSSPVNFADRLKGALFIAHGISDDNVHVQNTYQMIDALLKANKYYEFYAYPQKDHGIWGEEYRIHLFTRMLEFFENNLKK